MTDLRRKSAFFDIKWTHKKTEKIILHNISNVKARFDLNEQKRDQISEFSADQNLKTEIDAHSSYELFLTYTPRLVSGPFSNWFSLSY